MPHDLRATPGRPERETVSRLEKTAHAVLLAFVASVPLDVWPVAHVGSLSALLGLPLVAISGLVVLKRASVVRPTLHLVSLGAFVAYAAASALWSSDFSTTIGRTITYAQLLLFVFVFQQFVRTEANQREVSMAYVVGCAVAAVGTFVNYGRGEVWATEVRYVAAGYDPNDLGVTLAIGIPVAWHLTATRRRVLRVCLLAYVPAALVAIGLTASRGAAIAALPALIGPVSSAWRRGWRGMVGAAATGMGVVYVLIDRVPTEAWTRVFTIRDQLVGGTLGQRLPLWRAGWRVFVDHWFWGTGAGTFAHSIGGIAGEETVAHNTLLTIGAELGLVGLALFYGPLLNISIRLIRSNAPGRGVLLSVLATWFVGTSALTWDYRKTTWLFIALGLAVVRAHDAAARRNAKESKATLAGTLYA